MLARLQQFTTLGLIAAALTWLVYFIRAASPGLAALGAVLILFGYSLLLGAEFALLTVVNRREPVPPAALAQLLKAWWGETLTALQVFCWRQPFRSNAEPDFLPTQSGQRGVVLVHGFVCNRGVWNPLMRRLRRLGVPFVAVNLEPVFGSIDDYAGTIDAAVHRVALATGQPPVVVAHSMGGLAVRAWLAAYDADSQVHRVVTIGTPHRGTFLGRFAHTQNTRQMRMGSHWQCALAAREPLQRFQRFTCLFSHCDNVVFPATSATLPGADNKHVPGAAHVELLQRDEVTNEVLRWVGLCDERPNGEPNASIGTVL